MTSLKKKAAKGVLWIGIEKIIKAVLQLLVMAVLARLLDATEFGLMGLALMVTSFSDIFNDMGFGPAITQKEKLSKIDIHTGFSYSLIFGVCLIGIIWILSPFLAAFFDNEELSPILKAISFVLFFNGASATPLGVMFRNMEFKKLSLIRTFSYFIGYAATAIIFAYLGYGVWALVIAVIVQSIMSMLFYFYFNKESIGLALNSKSFKSLIHFGGGYSMSKVFSFFANQGDKIVVGKVLGVETLGLYERGYTLTKYSAQTLGEVIDKALFSPFSRRQSDKKLISSIFLDMTYLFAIVFLPLSAFLITFAKPLVRFVLGVNWDDSIIIVQVMSILVFFLISTRIGSTIAKSLGDVYRRAWRTLFVGIVLIFLVFIGAKWGIIGAAIGVVISKVIDYFLAFHQVKLLTGTRLRPFFKAHVLGIFLFLVYFVLFFIYKKIFGEINSNVLQLISGGFILIIIYSVALLFDKRKVINKYLKQIM